MWKCTLFAVITALLPSLAATQGVQDPKLVGTWTSKSRKVITGPSFYNPVTDRFTEPSLTGISYSFTADGYYEEAYYRAIPNPANPSCPSGMMQWQHGRYYLPGNGSIYLQPIGVDGRQLTSTPCQYKNSVYARYYQPEFIKSYEVIIDGFHNIQRLNLFQFDGSPQQPLYLAYSPPEMLPTQTLNPTSVPSATGKAQAKRDEEPQVVLPMEGAMHSNAIVREQGERFHPDQLWWAGVGMVMVGGAMYMYPASKSR